MEKFEATKIDSKEVKGGLSFYPGSFDGNVPNYPTGWPFNPGSGPVNLADLF